MRYGTVIRAALALGLATAVGVLAVAYRPVNAAAALTSGKADLKSAGALAFGPDGVLFVGDSIGGTVVALDTSDRTARRTAKIDVAGHRSEDRRAGRRDAGPDHDQRHRGEPDLQERLRVRLARPRSGRDAAGRARGTESGKVTPLALDNIGHASVSLADAPVSNPAARAEPADRRPSPIWHS